MASEAFDYLSRYYGAYDEDARLLSKHGQVEFLTTMRYITRYLSPQMHILEIGAGTGRYSHTLARKGYSVSAVELIPRNIEIFQANTAPGEDIRVVQGNATDLSKCKDDAFDMTLLLGPMYHLFTVDEQKQALSEALRVTKENGLLFVAYCMSDASILNFGFRNGNIFSLIEKGMLDPVTFRAFSSPEDLFELYRKTDIDALLNGLPVKRLHFVAADLYTNYFRETIDAMDDDTFAVYLSYHFSVCEREDMTGITHHSLDILKKLS
ncbi:MAG TPA: methyltransferase domain-containing protein [Clostridia bacterium]|nr:methyltransferase domain-containing protein [Clostridia bacterium]